MLSLLKEYWGTALFWCIAAGFAVSDIRSVSLQWIFWGIGLLFLVPPLRKELNKICVIPSELNPSPARQLYDRVAKGVFIGLVVLLLGSWFGFIYYITRPTPHPLHDMPLREIHNVTFTKESVKVDGNAFYDCTFTDVTFLYNGTTHFKIMSSKLNGTIKIKTSNFEAQHVMKFLGSLGALKNGFEVEGPAI